MNVLRHKTLLKHQINTIKEGKYTYRNIWKLVQILKKCQIIEVIIVK